MSVFKRDNKQEILMKDLLEFLKRRIEDLFNARKFYEKAEKTVGYLTTDERLNYNNLNARIDEITKFIEHIEKALGSKPEE